MKIAFCMVSEALCLRKEDHAGIGGGVRSIVPKVHPPRRRIHSVVGVVHEYEYGGARNALPTWTMRYDVMFPERDANMVRVLLLILSVPVSATLDLDEDQPTSVYWSGTSLSQQNYAVNSIII